ncbi:MAG TPA: NAD(P)-dependent alcohol dehydrogenase [Verrucomicrobiae bacterium]|nr:NAD(P)-dependent alcohol dehydrogenase [Verrucomicrobiae bacterium]
MQNNTKAYAAMSATTPLVPFSFHHRDPEAEEIEIQIQYCGVCHTDVHQARNEWKGTTFPCVPGHEIVGRVTKKGSKVKKFKEGDLAAVGCMVDSCRQCEPCKSGEEQLCDVGPVWTYNSEDKKHGGMTYGGYSTAIVVDQAYALRLPKGLDLAASAPLLCAGITTYSPLRRWKAGKGRKVGVVGLGGLGHMAVKLANAFGARVVLFTRTPGKSKDAIRLGAKDVVLSTSEAEMKKHANSFDFILDTVAAPHDVNPYLELLKHDATLTLVGVPTQPLAVEPFSIIGRRRRLAGSCIGGIRETQDMLDFCGEHGITSDIELIPIQKINEAYDRLVKSDVKYRFVIDMKTLG